MITDTETLPVPLWLVEAVGASTRAALVDQAITVAPAWWQAALSENGFTAAEYVSSASTLMRRDLFRLGERAGQSGEDARVLLWACLSWGTGRRHRHNRIRVRSVAAQRDELSERLRRAAELSRSEPEAAYAELRPQANAVSHLGPPFFSKFLYFAGGGDPDHPSLILDSLVAEALRCGCGWTSLTGRYVWPTTTYGRYCRLLTRWSQEVGEEVGRTVGADELELQLFSRAQQDRRGG